jgi:hypothetical protein
MTAVGQQANLTATTIVRSTPLDATPPHHLTPTPSWITTGATPLQTIQTSKTLS